MAQRTALVHHRIWRRYGGYANVWWSMANEWDFVKCKGRGVPGASSHDPPRAVSRAILRAISRAISTQADRPRGTVSLRLSSARTARTPAGRRRSTTAATTTTTRTPSSRTSRRRRDLVEIAPRSRWILSRVPRLGSSGRDLSVQYLGPPCCCCVGALARCNVAKGVVAGTPLSLSPGAGLV